VKQILTLKVNGDMHELAVTPRQTLLDVLRDQLGLTGTKRGCGTGACGVCTVIIDGRPVLSCLTLAVECAGRSITTIEGIRPDGEALHPLQQAFIDSGAVQCGFCTPGIIMTAKALLDANPRPSPDEIRAALAGTICRCTGHVKTVEAVQKAAADMNREEGHAPTAEQT
jgi:carbon-monoxide dehydrogenase small subunit